MIMKRIIFIFALMLVVVMAHADDYNYLIFAQSSGSQTAVEAEGLTITFSDGYLIATSADGTVTRLPLNEMSSMWFSESAATGITTVGASQATVQTDGNSIITQAARGTRYTVATPSGIVMAQGLTTGEATETIASGLAKGLYVIRIGERSIKLQVR